MVNKDGIVLMEVWEPGEMMADEMCVGTKGLAA